jgi:hypothetical protein
MYVVGIALAIWITRQRRAACGGNPDLVYDVALWAVPAGIVGGPPVATPARITASQNRGVSTPAP